MLQVLEAKSPSWADQLPQLCHRSGTAILITHCQSADVPQQLLKIFPGSHPVSLLSDLLQVIASDVSLGEWSAQPHRWIYTHVYLLVSPSSPATATDSTFLRELQRLIDIVAQLRSPTGCPWDRAQTPQSLTPFILEEAYEAVAAIRSADLQAIADELGDLLLQVVLQAQIFSESGVLTLAKIAAGTADKLIRRHPHVFEAQSDPVQDLGQLHQTWEQIKQAEQPEQTLSDKLLHYAHTLPPLMAALKISNKVVRAGFEWPEVEGIWAKMREEEAELREVLAVAPDTLTPAEIQSLRRQQSGELGDLLFTLVNLGRWYGLEAAEALQNTNLKFAQRFQRVEQLARELHQDPPRHLSEFSVQELDELWQQAKAQESP